jgi:hypothetical protein
MSTLTSGREGDVSGATGTGALVGEAGTKLRQARRLGRRRRLRKIAPLTPVSTAQFLVS